MEMLGRPAQPVSVEVTLPAVSVVIVQVSRKFYGLPLQAVMLKGSLI